MRNRDERKVAAITAATLQLVSEQGLAGFKMSTLARRAGVATGTLYTYYKDKQDLLLSIMLAVKGRGARQLREIMPTEGTYPERLRAVIRSYTRFIHANREGITFSDLLKRSPYMTEAAAAAQISGFAFLIEFVEEGQALGFVRTAPPERLLHLVDSLAKAMLDTAGFTGEDPEATATATADYVWSLLKA